MTTLLSADEKHSYELLSAKAYSLQNGEKLIVSNAEEIKQADDFLQEHGLFGVYFNPANETEEFNDWHTTSIGEDAVILSLYKS